MIIKAAIPTPVPLASTFGSPFGETYSLGSLVSVIVSSAIVVAGVIMLFLFVGGGLSMIAGAGNNDPRSTAQGKQAVTMAVIGFLIVFTAYWIVRIIELMTGTDFITNPFGSPVL